MTPPLWRPSDLQREQTAMDQFRLWVGERFEQPLADYSALHQWSISDPELFWESVWTFCDVHGEQGCGHTLVNKESFAKREAMQIAPVKWFPDAKLNFTANLLKRKDDRPALVFHREDGLRRSISYRQLNRQVAQLSNAMSQLGVSKGDVVAGYMPNCIETVLAALATSAIGAIWTSCSPDFGTKGVLDRFNQTCPKLLFSVDGYLYNGKTISLSEKLEQLTGELPSIETLVLVPYLTDAQDAGSAPANQQKTYSSKVTFFHELLSDQTDCFTFPELAFDHPLYVLYSSGTTGIPKCIVHGAGGTLLQHRKEHLLHCDIQEQDVVFYFTTCGWMMWNWLISGLASGATLILYDGNPLVQPGKLWQIAEKEKISVFGTSAKYLSALEKSGFQPGSEHDLTALRMLLSTGSPLTEEGFDFVYQHISKDICLASISGGTDIVSCFALGNPALPVWRGELQCMGLGMDVSVFNPAGKARQDQKGELVCRLPFPSMPLGFWGDEDGEKYFNAYFKRFPGVWAHGDYAKLTPHQGVIIYGRADATLNPGGVRIGTAEIYRPVEKLEEILESLAIGQSWKGEQRIVLFVVLRPEHTLDARLQKRIRTQIRNDTTPRHIPAKIIQVPELPKTLSGKLVELAVQQVVHGSKVENTEALANPEALDFFANCKELSSD